MDADEVGGGGRAAIIDDDDMMNGGGNGFDHGSSIDDMDFLGPIFISIKVS